MGKVLDRSFITSLERTLTCEVKYMVRNFPKKYIFLLFKLYNFGNNIKVTFVTTKLPSSVVYILDFYVSEYLLLGFLVRFYYLY